MKVLRINKRISHKIILQISLFTLSLCFLLGFIAYKISSKTLKSNIERSLSGMAKQSSSLISSTIEQDIKSMEAIANNEKVKSLNPNLMGPILNEEEKRLNYLGLLFVDENAVIHFPGGGTFKIDLTKPEEEVGYIKKALKGQSYTSNPVVDTKGTIVLSIAVPVKESHGNVKGLFIENFNDLTENLSVSMDEMVENMKMISLSSNEVADSTGNIVSNITDVNIKNLELIEESSKSEEHAQNLNSLVKEFKI